MLMATLTVVTASPIEPTTSVNSSFCPLCLEENFRDLPVSYQFLLLSVEISFSFVTTSNTVTIVLGLDAAAKTLSSSTILKVV